VSNVKHLCNLKAVVKKELQKGLLWMPFELVIKEDEIQQK
jgi:hypothetical protein